MKCKRRVFDPSVCLVPLISAHCVNISRAWNLFENLVAFGDCWFIKLLTVLMLLVIRFHHTCKKP